MLGPALARFDTLAGLERSSMLPMLFFSCLLRIPPFHLPQLPILSFTVRQFFLSLQTRLSTSCPLCPPLHPQERAAQLNSDNHGCSCGHTARYRAILVEEFKGESQSSSHH
jgi:hypothetical protein